MKKNIFITAVDTEVGKTLCACGLVESLIARGLDIGVFKPVLSGAKQWIPADAVMLKSAAKSKDELKDINPYCFETPVTPAHAAHLENITISKNSLISARDIISDRHDATIIEGAGGLMVPIKDDYLMIDLIKELACPVIVITDCALGRINHTLMTLKILKNYGVEILGLIVNRYPKEPGEAAISLLKYIKLFDNTEIIGVIPEIEAGESFYDDFVGSFKDNVDLGVVERFIKGMLPNTI